MILVFDLDDTLYDESAYVKSGLHAVARSLAREYGLPRNQVYATLASCVLISRDRVIDRALEALGLHSKAISRKCVSVYRSHVPRLRLYPDAKRCLRRFKESPLYVVTDGNKLVQEAKVKALDLEPLMQHVFITHRFGKRNAKPSPHCFLNICARERCKPSDVVYIGDDPSKDFVAIKKLGFLTVRVLRGRHRSVRAKEGFEAHVRISNLDELNERVLEKLRQIAKDHLTLDRSRR